MVTNTKKDIEKRDLNSRALERRTIFYRYDTTARVALWANSEPKEPHHPRPRSDSAGRAVMEATAECGVVAVAQFTPDRPHPYVSAFIHSPACGIVLLFVFVMVCALYFLVVTKAVCLGRFCVARVRRERHDREQWSASTRQSPGAADEKKCLFVRPQMPRKTRR